MNSDFSSKDTSLWLSGICIVLMASIKFSVDCSLCLDSSVRGFSTSVKYLDGWQVGDPQKETMGRIGAKIDQIKLVFKNAVTSRLTMEVN